MLQPVDTGETRQTAAIFLSDFLTGKLRIDGFFKLLLIGLTRQFKGTASGTWRGEVLLLDESFVYDNGRKEQRTWRLKFEADGAFTSTCSDVVGAGQGRFDGKIYVHSYMFRLPFGRNGFHVRINEIYELLDGSRVQYTARMSRWGIPLGTIEMEIAQV